MAVLAGARIDGDVYGRTGDAPWDLVTWGLFEQHAGKTASLVHFGQPAPWRQAFQAAPFDKCWKRNAVPLCSMDLGGASLADVAAGRQDAAIQAWAKAAAAYAMPLMLRWCWEMNGTWFPHGKEAAANPAVYVKAWQRFFDVVKAAGAWNVTSVWCPNVVFPGSTPLEKLWPGVTHVDWMGMDGYNFGAFSWRSFAETFDHTYIELLALSSRPIAVCEVGCAETGGSKADWISRMFADLPVYQRIRAFAWFNWNIVENGVRRDWPIESSPGAQAAYAAGLSSSWYLAAAAAPVAGAKVVPQ